MISIQIWFLFKVTSAIRFLFCQHIPFCIRTASGFLRDIDSCVINQQFFDKRRSKFVKLLALQHASASYYYWYIPSLLNYVLLTWEGIKRDFVEQDFKETTEYLKHLKHYSTEILLRKKDIWPIALSHSSKQGGLRVYDSLTHLWMYAHGKWAAALWVGRAGMFFIG